MNPAAPESGGEHGTDPDPTASTPPLQHSSPSPFLHSIPAIPDHELLKKIGGGSYGDVWLARSKLGTYRAVKIIYRATFEDSRPFEREFKGMQKFEPISRSHEGLVDILQVGGTEEYFYYVMELADDAGENPKTEIRDPKQAREENPRSETRNPKEVRTPNTEKASEGKPVRNSAFGVASGFGIRNSDSY